MIDYEAMPYDTESLIEQYDAKLKEFVEKMIDVISNVTNVDLRQDTELYNGLLIHLRPTIFRLKYNRSTNNELTGYIKNITEDTLENISSNAIITKDKITYINNDVKHIIHIKNNELILIRETNEFKNILTFSLNRSILSEYVIKKEDLCLEINIKTLELSITDKIIYINSKR